MKNELIGNDVTFNLFYHNQSTKILELHISDVLRSIVAYIYNKIKYSYKYAVVLCD